MGASAIAGLMMVYQIRQSSDVVNSTKAVFAADSGVEWELYRMFKDSDYPKPIMTNQTDFSTTVSGSNIVKSVGSSNRSSRAFEITIQ